MPMGADLFSRMKPFFEELDFRSTPIGDLTSDFELLVSRQR